MKHRGVAVKKYLLQKMHLKEDQSIFLFVNSKTLRTGTHNIDLDKMLSEIYEEYKDQEDLYLYVTYSSIASFGNPN